MILKDGASVTFGRKVWRGEIPDKVLNAITEGWKDHQSASFRKEFEAPVEDVVVKPAQLGPTGLPDATVSASAAQPALSAVKEPLSNSKGTRKK